MSISPHLWVLHKTTQYKYMFYFLFENIDMIVVILKIWMYLTAGLLGPCWGSCPVRSIRSIITNSNCMHFYFDFTTEGQRQDLNPPSTHSGYKAYDFRHALLFGLH